MKILSLLELLPAEIVLENFLYRDKTHNGIFKFELTKTKGMLLVHGTNNELYYPDYINGKQRFFRWDDPNIIRETDPSIALEKMIKFLLDNNIIDEDYLKNKRKKDEKEETKHLAFLNYIIGD